jgi:mRNA-degrading endonuclease RelE of RelBE toxin-antitoxin system
MPRLVHLTTALGVRYLGCTLATRDNDMTPLAPANISNILLFMAVAVAVLLTKAAAKDIDDLPAAVQARVADKIVELAAYPKVSNIKALKGALKGQHRARIGEYRIIFTVSGETLTITSVVIRGGAYD